MSITKARGESAIVRIMKKRKIVVIINNVRSAHNAGSILRSADSFAVDKVYFTGYTPYPAQKNDRRLPHIQKGVSYQIHKTALGAEDSVNWIREENIHTAVKELKNAGYNIIALEQTPKSLSLNKLKAPEKIALIVGNEIEGIDAETVKLADKAIEIPQLGSKESLNVAVATAVALYHLRFLV